MMTFDEALCQLANGQQIRHALWAPGYRLLIKNDTISSQYEDEPPQSDWRPTFPEQLKSADWEIVK